MKILHILYTPRAEGTPRLVLDWLQHQEHQQEVYVLHDEPKDLSQDLRRHSLWYQEDHLITPGKKKFFQMVSATAKVCSERQPDLVICWVTGFANWIGLGCKLAGVKHLIVHAGNPSKKGFKESLLCNMIMLPLKLIGAELICCSQYVLNSIRVASWTMPSAHAIWNCTHASTIAEAAQKSREQRSPNEKVKIGIMVATLEDHKDHETLLKAMIQVKQQLPDFRLKLVGDGSKRQNLTEQISQLGLSDCVEMLGMRKDVPYLLGQSDLFIFSTTPQEGLGSVLLEAMAASLPIIATDVPACRETLEDGKRGTLVPASDPDPLAKAILQHFSKPKNSSLIEDNFHFSLSFTAARMMESYFKTLDS